MRTMQKVSFVSSVIVVLGLAGCGGSDSGASSSTTTSSSSSSTSGGTSAQPRRPAPPPPPQTSGPTEESPGVYTGVVTCNQPGVIELDGTATEIITFQAELSLPAGAAGDGNAGVTLHFGEEAVLAAGNPVAIGGVVTAGTPVTGSATLNVQQSGRHALKVEVEQCVALHYRVTLTRDVPAATNATRDTATTVVAGTPATGSVGCGEERWFAYEARRRGRLNVTFGGEARQADTGGVATLTLETADGPVMASGNPIAVEAPFNSPAAEPATATFAIPRPGRYLLHLAFTNGCTVSNYTVGVAP